MLHKKKVQIFYSLLFECDAEQGFGVRFCRHLSLGLFFKQKGPKDAHKRLVAALTCLTFSGVSVKVLKSNGAPSADMSIICGTSSWAQKQIGNHNIA